MSKGTFLFKERLFLLRSVLKKILRKWQQFSWVEWSGDVLAQCLRCFPPERAHHISLVALSQPTLCKFFPSVYTSCDVSCEVPGMGYLSHPIGIAAGYDKNAVCVDGLYRLGFSMIEVGTITPQAQIGATQPRIFRYPGSRDLINRMGFPNSGVDHVVHRLRRYAKKESRKFVLGVNIGKNLDTPRGRALEDYLVCLERVKDYGDYFVINVSSPNTEGLRDLVNPEFFRSLSENLRSIEAGLSQKVWVKLDPDREKHSFQQTVEHIGTFGFGGLILTNTRKVHRPQKGGLSGHSLRTASHQRLFWAREVYRNQLPIIAVGGIMSGWDVIESLRCGASCVQVYTALIYRGPWLVHKMLREIEWQMEASGITHLSEIQKGTE